ncbi:MAG: hypothetical protein M3Y49_11745 [Actinomycetota bacterium]|nr:hypothetical protein [Actinomycetota bacterium]
MVAAEASIVNAKARKVGAEPNAPFLDPVDLTEKEAIMSQDQHIYGNVVALNGLSLDSGWFHPTNRWSEKIPPPATIETGAAKRAEVRGMRPGMVFTYRIVDAGKPTDFWVGAKFYEPSFRAAEWDCQIYEGGDPRTDGAPTILAPYTCLWGNVHGYNPHPGLSVGKATVVTNKAQAKLLLTKYCNSPGAESNCAFVDFGYGTALGPYELASNYAHNTSDEEAESKVVWETETSQENSVGIDLKNEFEIFKVWKLSLTLKYEHKWETSQKFGEELGKKIPGNSAVWYTYATRMQATMGTWVVNTGEQRYSIPNISLSTPLRTGGVLEVHTCKWSELDTTTGVCHKGLTTQKIPSTGIPSASSGKS